MSRKKKPQKSSIPRRQAPGERSFGTSVLVQSNYAGWLLGAVVTPVVAGHEKRSFVALLKWQAVFGCGLVVLGLAELCGRGGPPWAKEQLEGPLSEATTEASSPRLLKALWSATSSRRWVLLCLAYSVCAGVGFTVPAVQDVVIDLTCSSDRANVATVANAAFILAGILVGLALGKAAPEAPRTSPGPVLLGLFSLATLTIATLHVALVSLRTCNLGLVAVLMALSGGATIGFVGFALREAAVTAASLDPAAALFSSGFIEFWVQVFGECIGEPHTRRSSKPFGGGSVLGVEAAARRVEKKTSFA